MEAKEMITLNGGLGARYSFGTFGDAIKRLAKWEEGGMINEEEICAFIIQLFHAIPENMYNDIIEKS